MSKTITCVAAVIKCRKISIPKIICSRFNKEALNNIGFFCNYEKKIIILSVQRNSVPIKVGGSARIRRRTKTGVPIGCICGLQKNTALALNFNYKDLVYIIAEYDENGEGQIVIEKYEDNKEARYGNN